MGEKDIEEIEKLKKERENYITRLFWFALEIAFIFLIPALIAVYLAGGMFGVSPWYGLPFSFLLSWVIVIVRYRQLSKKLTSLDKRIKELKEEK